MFDAVDVLDTFSVKQVFSLVVAVADLEQSPPWLLARPPVDDEEDDVGQMI